MFVPQVLKILLTILEVMGRVEQTVAFQAGTWQESRACPDAKTGEELSAEDKTWLSKYTNMDNGQRIWWVVASRNQKFVDNTIMVRQARQMGRSPTLEAKLWHSCTRNGVTVQTAEGSTIRSVRTTQNKEEQMELIVTYGVEV
jgi:hypothetical protein